MGNGPLRPRVRSRRSGQFGALVLTSLVLLSLTFLLGFLVGRHSAQREWREARTEKDGGAAVSGQGRARESARPPQIQERLTFYHTLTAPPASAPPTPTAKDGTGAPGQAAPAKEAGREHPWTVQVGAYRNRTQAAALQRSLAAAGYDAYLRTASGQDGTVHYRVRVGTYPTRAQAEQFAERLRADRSLMPLVVPW